MRAVVLAIPDAAAVVVCAIAVVTDLRHLRISNRLTFTAIAGGFVLNVGLGVLVSGASGGAVAFGSSLLGAVLALVVFGLPASIDLVGMGDVKLMVALGALVRWPLALPLLLYVAVAGGAVAAGYGIASGRWKQRMPYGLAIALGCAWAVASRYWPALGLL